MPRVILFDKYRFFFLSNFYTSPIVIDGYEYPTVEHYYQSMKTLNFEEQRQIMSASTPKESRQLGRKCTIRSDWEQIKVDVMRKGLYAKFTQNEQLKSWLLKTGDAVLVENAWWDSFWGNGRDGKGQNMLGKLLMELREQLRKQEG